MILNCQSSAINKIDHFQETSRNHVVHVSFSFRDIRKQRSTFLQTRERKRENTQNVCTSTGNNHLSDLSIRKENDRGSDPSNRKFPEAEQEQSGPVWRREGRFAQQARI